MCSTHLEPDWCSTWCCATAHATGPRNTVCVSDTNAHWHTEVVEDLLPPPHNFCRCHGNRYTPGALTRLCQSTGEVAATRTVSPTHHRTPPFFPLSVNSEMSRPQLAAAMTSDRGNMSDWVWVFWATVNWLTWRHHVTQRTADPKSLSSICTEDKIENRVSSPLLSSTTLAQHFDSALLCNVLSVNCLVVNTPSLHLRAFLSHLPVCFSSADVRIAP